jgi:hypothetical protein
LRSATYATCSASIFDSADLEPFCNEAQDALVRDPVLEETDNPRVGHGIEKGPDVRIEHPVHLLPEDTNVESVQRVVLAASRPESVRKPEKVFLVDCFQNRRDCLLNDFVLQAQNAQGPFRAIRFGMWVRLAGRARYLPRCTLS